MTSDRRFFIGAAPLLALGIDELAESLYAAQTSSAHDLDALNFWIYGTGIPKSAIPAAGEIYTRGGQKDTGPQSSINREPIFLHYDEDEKALIPSDSIPRQKLAPPSGDAQVDFQLQRLRLNAEDERQFSRFTSGGIYMDMQQHPELAPLGSSNEFVQLASSLFSAFFSGSGSSKGGGRSGGKSTGKAGGNNFLQSGAAGKPAAGQAVALQQGNQSQSLVLSNGVGKAMFVAFVKDRRQSAFGQFVQALAGKNTSSFSQLLSIPLLAAPALTAIRTIVANLQIDGGNQAVIMQSPPLNIAATAAGMDLAQSPLPVRSGGYIALPQEQGSLIKPQLDKLKILKGYLVPKEVDELDLNDDLISNAAPGISYLSLGVNVKKATKGSGCTVPSSKS